jgi:hypothetical protein
MPQQNYPRPSSRRVFPRSSENVIFPLASTEEYFVVAGASKFVSLGDRVYPYAELDVRAPSGVAVSGLERQYSGEGSWAAVAMGANPDLETALKFYSVIADSYWTRTYRVRVTYSDATVRIAETTVAASIQGLASRITKNSLKLRVFAGVSFATDPDLVAAVSYAVSGATTVAKTEIPRETIVTGRHTGPDGSASLVDTNSDFTELGVIVGDLVSNTAPPQRNFPRASSGRIFPQTADSLVFPVVPTEDVSATTITGITTTANQNDTVVGILSGGSENDWDTGDAFTISLGCNQILLAQNFNLGGLNSGMNRVTLYVKDTSAIEVESSLVIRVI